MSWYENPDGTYKSLDRALAQVRTKRTVYQVTRADINAGYAGIPVIWDEPFRDRDYTVTWSAEDPGTVLSKSDFGAIDSHSITATGFIAVVTSLNLVVNGKFLIHVGDPIIIHAIGIHD